jgi:ubiquinone/menaquinone biosynthesis C-methylase UbiE
MRPEQYDAWYRTPRGAWIGDVEYRLLVDLLQPRPGETLLDVGCGTGWFTRRFAREAGMQATGLDPDDDWLAYAQAQARPGERFVQGRAERLSFPDRSVDCTTCITALCFVAGQEQALREMLRVTRRRIVLGLLNRARLRELARADWIETGKMTLFGKLADSQCLSASNHPRSAP